MSSEDIKRVEQELKVKLPDHYIEYVTSIPSKVIGIKKQLGYFPFLFDNPEEIITVNQHLGFYDTSKFIKHKLCIGENGGGDYYLIDLNEVTNQKVYFFDHEESVDNYYNKETNTLEFEKLDFSGDLKAHINEVLEIFGM